ncbi:MAG TPA: hypothetical protein VLK59_09980 [Solirubrobacteraceae bacterium]|nr:hypothetical protein [Solirubrobacteraceae bacterium]
MVGEQDLAQRAGMGRQQRPDVEGLEAVVRAEDVVDDQHLALVERPDAHALVGAGGQRVRPVQRPRAQLVAVEVARAHVQQRGAELVFAGLLVLLHEADVLERTQQTVHRSLRQAELSRQVDDAQPACAPGQQAQDRGGTLDRLDVLGQEAGLRDEGRSEMWMSELRLTLSNAPD